MHRFLIDVLQCPACGSELQWTVRRSNEIRIEDAEATCRSCAAAYPVREEIGIFLTPDLPRNDLWEQLDNRLALYLRAHPEVEGNLTDGPIELLNPADQMLRAFVLEDRGKYEDAQMVLERARTGLYTTEYVACYESQVAAVLARLKDASGVIVDLASGRGSFLEVLARRVEQPLVGSDFSPGILRRDRHRFQALGLYDTVSLLAFDVRRTPFRDGSVTTMTSNLGLSNVEQPEGVLTELRRIAGGWLLSITHFYPDISGANAEAISELGISDLIFRDRAMRLFRASGWNADLTNTCHGIAEPTPASEILEGTRVDGLPVEATTLEWCVLAAC